MNTSLFRWAFGLIFMSLIGAFFVPVAAIPRLALSAHTIGMMSGLLLIAVGAIWPHFKLSERQLGWLKWSWIYSSYANWMGCLIGGMLGAGRTTPVAAAGMEGSVVAEAIVLVLLASVGVVAVFAAGLSWWGVRPSSERGHAEG